MAITGYETFSKILRKRIINALGSKNVYEARTISPASLIPDHKFPEIRWDALTRIENSDEMSEEDIRDKFQLLDNQRNQQKREACRTCFQTDKRGKVYGIDYYYAGNETWAVEVKTGKDAEIGCVGCSWYDLQKWRESLNYKIKLELFSDI